VNDYEVYYFSRTKLFGLFILSVNGEDKVPSLTQLWPYQQLMWPVRSKENHCSA